jgi:hypothetical protein
VDSNFLGSRGVHLDSVLASWEKAPKAIKNAKKSRDNCFIGGLFGAVI